MTELINDVDPKRSPHRTLTVVAVYRPRPGRYWFKATPTGQSGLIDSTYDHDGHDWWITGPATMNDGRYASTRGDDSWTHVTNEADFLLRVDTVGLDDLLRMRDPAQKFLDEPVQVVGLGTGQATAIATSGIVDLADAAAHGRHQANVLVPLFMIQLALLAALTLWLVLGAAIEQRRPEVAIARLRGRSSRGARTMLLSELLPLVAIGLLAGIGGAFALSYAARHTWLASGVPFELRLPVLWTALAAAISLVVMLLAAAQRTSVAPPAELLRRVVPRRRGWVMGVGDLLVVVVSGAAFLAFATGSLTGAAGTAAPTLLALAVGLLLAHSLGPVSAGVGRRLLHRSRVPIGLAMLQIARRPGTRKVIATITVAAALLAFACDALAVGARNRTARAQAETGASLVATISGSRVGAARAALHQVDPDGHQVTPVAEMTTPGEGGTATLAVVPGQFARIADFPGLDPTSVPWQRLAPPKTPPIRVRGKSMTLRVKSDSLLATAATGGTLEPGDLRALLVGSNGVQHIASLATLPVNGSARHTVKVAIPCENGCLLTGFEEYAGGFHPPFSTAVEVTDITVAGRTVGLGGTARWRKISHGDSGWMSASGIGGGLRFTLHQSGPSAVDVQHRSVPTTLPALVSGHLPSDARGKHFNSPGLDGIQRAMTKVGSLPYVPGDEPSTALVNLDVLQRDGATPATTTSVRLYFAHDDPALLRKVTNALATRGVAIESTTSVRSARRRYTETAATWGLQLGVVVGATAALLAALVLIIAVATSWRLRSRDYAALRMTGVRRRHLALISVGEQLPVVLLSIVLGVVCGVVGAHFAMPDVPLFASPPDIPIIDLSTSWPAVLAAAGASAVVLGVVAWISGRWVATRAHLTTLRETL